MEITTPCGENRAADKPESVSSQAAELKRQYTIALALVICLILAMQVLIFSSLKVQQRLARIEAQANEHQQLTQQVLEIAAAPAAGSTFSPERAAELRQLVGEWYAVHYRLLKDLAWRASADGPRSAATEPLRLRLESRPLTDAAGIQNDAHALAKLVPELEPQVAAEAAAAIGGARQAAASRRDWLWGAGIAIVAFTVAVLGFQSWCVFGRALWLVKHEQQHVDQITRRSALILDSAGEAIWCVDRAGCTTYVNPAATKVSGWSAEELLGKSQHDVLRHCNAEGVQFEASKCPICKAFREGKSHYAPGDVFWRKDQTTFPAEYHSTPISEGNEIVGAVLTFRDISEHRMLQSKLVHAQKLESIGQLAAGIAHEINTPIQFIGDNTRFLKDAFESLQSLLTACEQVLAAAERGEPTVSLIEEARALAEAADMPYLSEEVPKSIDQSLEGIARVTKIVRAMKDFSHPDGDAKAPTDINRAIESTVTVARNEWKYVAELQLDLDPDLPPVACLAGALNQVILNLVVNAAHAIAELRGENTVSKGLITISTRREDDLAVIRIRDTGGGIPPAIRAKVFDPFFTTKPVGKGTGQGLAIAHTVVVEKHGGTIGLESEVGVGTTFTIRLPFGTGEAMPEESEYETAHCAH
jgi:PAS domain S-box-containing protein